MVTANVSYPDFSAGELSPKMYGRFDLAAFFNGGRRIENFKTQVGGMASYRTGAVYAAKTKGNNQAFLFRFIFSDALSYVLEFTNLALRFYNNNGQVRETAQAITNITQANPAVVTYSGADNYANGDSVFLTGIVGMVELNGTEAVVANVNVGANTFELTGVDSTSFTAYDSAGTVAVITELVTVFAEADLFSLKFAQDGVDLYIAHPTYEPQKLTFTDSTTWAIGTHAPTALTITAGNRPVSVGMYEQRLIYAGTNNDPNKIQFSKAGDFDDFTTGTGVLDGIAYTIAGGSNKTAWLAGTNQFLAIGGFEDVFQATGGQEEVITVDSVSIKPTNSFGVADIMPISKGTQIFYMQSNNLILRSFEYDLTLNSYTPVDRNTIADHITSSGVTQITYQEGRPNILWAVKNNGVLIGMTVEDTESISGWHRHTTEGTVISIATIPRATEFDQLWQCVKRNIDGVDVHYIEYYSDEVNYPRREDNITNVEPGDDPAVIEEADQELYENLLFESQKEYIHVDSAISYFGDILGLDAGATLTPAATTGTAINFTASTAIFDATMIGRELWRKSVDGTQTGRAEITAFTSTTVVVCTVLEDFDATTAIPAGEWFLTAGTFAGLDHLEGEVVTVVADGGQHTEQTVTSGAITLDSQTSVVHVGLGYTGYLETLDLEGGGTTGTAQTKKKNVHAVGFRFLDTLYARYGTSYYKLNQIEMRTASMKMDRPPLMFTGDTKEHYTNESADRRDGGWSREKRVIVAQDQPFPCNVQLVVPYMTVSN